MKEKTKKILSYTVLPVVFTGVLASSSVGLITGRKKEENPDAPHHELPVCSFFRTNYMTALNSSAAVITAFENFFK